MTAERAIQRLRLRYGVEGPMRYISVLEQGAVWERLLRRAGVPLAYSQGFNPRPRIQLGTALPVGYASDGEWIDLFLTDTVAPEALAAAIAPQLPEGLRLVEVHEVPLKAAAVQARVREAWYEVQVWHEAPTEAVRGAIERLLARDEVLRRRHKKGRMAEYDLRPLMLDITHEMADDGVHRLNMRLRAGPEGSGRPEEVLEELGLADARYCIRRRELILAPEEESRP